MYGAVVLLHLRIHKNEGRADMTDAHMPILQ